MDVQTKEQRKNLVVVITAWIIVKIVSSATQLVQCGLVFTKLKDHHTRIRKFAIVHSGALALTLILCVFDVAFVCARQEFKVLWKTKHLAMHLVSTVILLITSSIMATEWDCCTTDLKVIVIVGFVYVVICYIDLFIQTRFQLDQRVGLYTGEKTQQKQKHQNIINQGVPLSTFDGKRKPIPSFYVDVDPRIAYRTNYDDIS